jgi:hypothetical protein
MGGAVAVEPQRPRERVEHLRRRVALAALLQPHEVVAADAGQLGGEPDPDAPPPGWKTPQQGAATSVLLATSPQLEGIGGRLFEDCNEAVTLDRAPADWRAGGVAPYALDSDNAERLWEVSLRLLG